ncbi:YbjN domain-containing protein [Micromonospora tulbaghiae]|uniref:YbjN domain-containing protein n=1 Tax=Micromonospora tulbaghiae TaxID=479978 RepID=A0AAW4JII1_9ACTN|nr:MULTISPECIES: YbjN domain-containing protein [Micromonospora]KAB1904089.1 YbjN domain-containing protein [Micromonospora sp. AMSO1212t]MBO4141647.1 YbjN domain-containing protein [Micromonospora tulbaghiae]MDX5458029.1 YbjN domain-containing protein [Micromonospora tulbaghiae]
MASPEIEDGPDGPLAGHPQELRPLTGELIAAVLGHRGYAVVEEPDGALVGRWERNLIWFHRRGAAGELLQVRTVVAHHFGIERVTELHAFCNAWNHDRLWPKAYVHVADDGSAQVCGEVTTDLERGVTPHQLDRLVDCGVTTGCQLADAVDELAGGTLR